MNIDGIFVISLEKDSHRRKLMESWYPKGVLNFFIVNRMKDPERGCYSSHRKLVKYAKNIGYKKILILEDDAYPLDKWENIVDITNKALSSIDDWDFLMLGYLPFRTKKINDNVLKVYCAADAHSYIVNLERIDIQKWKGVPIDDYLFCNRTDKRNIGNYLSNNKQSNKVYATNPMLFTQKTDKSNIADTHLWQKWFIKFLGGEQKITKLSTSVNILSLLILIVIIPILLILLLCFNYRIPIGSYIIISIIVISLIIFTALNCSYYNYK